MQPCLLLLNHEIPLQTDVLVKEEEELNGLIPFFLEEKFFIVTADESSSFQSKERRIRRFNLNKMQEEEGREIVRSGRLVCILFQNNRIKYLLLDPVWLQKIQGESSDDWIYVDHPSGPIKKENTLFGLNQDSYHYLVKNLELDHLL